MSGFRKFRTTLQRRRKAELAGLGLLKPGGAPVPAAGGVRSDQAEPESKPLEFSPSVEAREIGPAPIVWLKPRRPDTDH